MKVQWTFIAGLVFAIIIAFFAVLNIEQVPVNYLIGQSQWPLILVILGSALLGAIISMSFSAVKLFKNGREHKTTKDVISQKENIITMQQEEIARLKEQVHKLKALPKPQPVEHNSHE